MTADLLLVWAAVLLGCVLSAALGFVLNASTSDS
jgi:hypothetical protein